jgi:Tfp pilus assembly pilus retraction ATPase PilT
MLTTPSIREMIRRGEDENLPAIVGRNEEGMQSFTKALAQLVEKEWVLKQVAMEYAPNREALDSTLKGLEIKPSTLVGKRS